MKISRAFSTPWAQVSGTRRAAGKVWIFVAYLKPLYGVFGESPDW